MKPFIDGAAASEPNELFLQLAQTVKVGISYESIQHRQLSLSQLILSLLKVSLELLLVFSSHESTEENYMFLQLQLFPDVPENMEHIEVVLSIEIAPFFHLHQSCMQGFFFIANNNLRDPPHCLKKCGEYFRVYVFSLLKTDDQTEWHDAFSWSDS